MNMSILSLELRAAGGEKINEVVAHHPQPSLIDERLRFFVGFREESEAISVIGEARRPLTLRILLLWSPKWNHLGSLVAHGNLISNRFARLARCRAASLSLATLAQG
jgi:hypothetical protein